MGLTRGILGKPKGAGRGVVGLRRLRGGSAWLGGFGFVVMCMRRRLIGGRMPTLQGVPQTSGLERGCAELYISATKGGHPTCGKYSALHLSALHMQAGDSLRAQALQLNNSGLAIQSI